MSTLKIPPNNYDLYQYLVGLSKVFESKKKTDAVCDINFAIQFAVGSPSEFFHESQTLLMSLQSKYSDVLSEKEMNDLMAQIKNIEDAFQRIGGA